MARAKDLTGQRFGKLTAVHATDKRADQGSLVWLCRCDCGNEKEVSSKRLLRGKVRSCGCLSDPPLKDYEGKRFGRLTVIEYAGRLNPNSTENYWRCICDCGKEITAGQTELQNGETKSCGCYARDQLLENLRLIDDTSVTILESKKEKLRADNRSGYTGVYQETSGMWRATIRFKKKTYWLGRYRDKEDAIRARKRGEEMVDHFLEWYYSEYPERRKSKD